LPFPYTVAVVDAAAVAYLFAVYGCNGTEFFYVIFTEQRNFTTAERRNGNRRTMGAGTGLAGWASGHPGKNQGRHGPPWKF